jgi:hypothetical protein
MTRAVDLLDWHPHVHREPDLRQGELRLDAERCENESDLGTTDVRRAARRRPMSPYGGMKLVAAIRLLLRTGRGPGVARLDARRTWGLRRRLRWALGRRR